MEQPQQTNPAGFVNPHSRGNKIGRLLWQIVWATLFRPTPSFMGAWRRLLLRIFGAKVGKSWVHQAVRVWAPWRLTIGKDAFVDRGTFLYDVYGMEIGDRVTISMGVFLCGASHDYQDPALQLIGGKIVVGNDTWIAADAFIAPGVTVGDGAVVGARAVVTKDVEPWMIVAGNPAKVIKRREMKTGGATAAPTALAGSRAES